MINWKRLKLFGIAVIGLLVGIEPCCGAVYYVSLDGSDGGTGGRSDPWRTIAKGASEAVPGDTVVVRDGHYDERVVTIRDGTDALRITYEASGNVVMRGWEVNHSYVTIRGFVVTGHSGTRSTDAYIKINNGAHYFRIESCEIRDGIGLKSEFEFSPPDRITAVKGGFLVAGFAPGQSISVLRGTNVNVLNQGEFVIASVTDDEITVSSGNIVSDGPKLAYISGAANLGLYVASDTEAGLIQSNRFSNLAFKYCFIQGRGHAFKGNTLENNNGWDLVHFSGTDHVLQGNLFRNGEWGVFQPSADIFDNWPTKYERIQFTNNFVQSFIGVINAQKRNNTGSGPLWITGNVFVDIGSFFGRFPNTTVEHNTFLRVGRQSSRAVQREGHPVIMVTEDYATNAWIRNNIFVDCGEPRFNQTEADIGWYEIDGPSESVVAEGNFCAGGPPAFGSKSNWPEDNPVLNGGDPVFANIDDPLGPDGMPFTEDDGLRLLATSKLVGAGVGGATIGAYAKPVNDVPTLSINQAPDGLVRLTWPEKEVVWVLQAAPTVSGSWTNVPGVAASSGGWLEYILSPEGKGTFFRLSQ